MDKFEISKKLVEKFKDLIIDSFEEWYGKLDCYAEGSEIRDSISHQLESLQVDYNELCESIGEKSEDLVTLI